MSVITCFHLSKGLRWFAIIVCFFDTRTQTTKTEEQSLWTESITTLWGAIALSITAAKVLIKFVVKLWTTIRVHLFTEG